MFRELLEGVAPAGIRTVADGEEALKVLESFPADIVLTEGNLTGMDSLNLLRAIRNKKTSPNADVLVVVMASMAENQRLQRMCGIGIEAFIKKPISNEIVLKRLVSTLSGPRRFVSSLGYFGPDRRGRVDGARPGPERRRVVEPLVKPSPPPEIPGPAEPEEGKAPTPEAKPIDPGKDYGFLKPEELVVRKAPSGPALEPEPEPIEEEVAVEEEVPIEEEAPEPETQEEAKEEAAWADEIAPPALEEEPISPQQAALNSKIQDHLEWMRSGGRSGQKASLEGEYLSGAQLRGVELADSNLRNVDFSDANLQEAILQGSDLRGANLAGADIREGDLTSANMRRVDLSFTQLGGACLAGTDLAAASLKGAEMSGTDLQGVNLLDTDLSGVDLSGVRGLNQK